MDPLQETMADAALLEAVKAINSGDDRFDVTIICTTDDHQAAYWMDRLASGLLQGTKVLAVSEDWGGSGAGNGLGTLYAYQKACKLAKDKYSMNLEEELSKGTTSAALYHTAGKGTRMAPLPASENNNKPGVKLPFGYVNKDNKCESLTVLESVIKQTGIYAKSRKGRLSVFWGDQVFLPSAPFTYAATHHVDILCTLLGETAPTAEEWVAQGLDKYGVIACIEKESGRLDAAQVEKVSHETATQMLAKLGSIRQVGPSLGSFSVSAAILVCLCREFAKELEEKTAKLDTDPHFWMPMTLSMDSYVQLMKQKETDEAESRAHYERIQQMVQGFDMGSLGLFGAVDVGKDACWWDYGQLKLYSRNSRLLLEDSESAVLLRKFLNIDSHVIDSDISGATLDKTSYAFMSKVGAGTVKESLLSGVACSQIDANGAIIVNCAAKSIKAGKGVILYNLIQEKIVAEDGQVMVSVTDEKGESFVLQSHVDIDGGKAWKQKLDMNVASFEQVHGNNKNANIQEISKQRKRKYDELASSF